MAFQEWHNVYAYDMKTLWAADSAAIFSTAIAVVAGFSAMNYNGAAYDSNFSTILRASHVHQPSTTADRNTEVGKRIDDGSQPFPKSLVKAVIIMNDKRQKSGSDTRSSDAEKGQMVLLQRPESRELELPKISKRHKL